MKNLLRSTLYLSVFALAGILFQISCSNSDNDNKTQSTSQINKIVYLKNIASSLQIWTCNYDGTSQSQIPINLPTNVSISYVNQGASPRLSPDGLKVFFITITNPTSGASYGSIYSCNIDGTNVQEVVAIPNADDIQLGGAY
ncbi:hypothetical protein [Flavobacterium sp.]|uniref:hypothetical protein n=1 Tax=Flavobacterium sp. TaxID=239 RepID=UPI002608F9A6|nr:hypothetical protein [Flavobacterium sp.]